MEARQITDCSSTLAKATERVGVHIKTFGCQMNEYDSEKIFNLLSDNYKPVQLVDEAEVVIINTCSVREKGEQKLFSFLGRLAKEKKAGRELVVGVCGCVAQQEGKRIIERERSVDFVVGTHNLSLIPELLERARKGADSQVCIDYRDEWEELPSEFDSFTEVHGEESFQKDSFGSFYSPPRAMVAIQRGCNKHCSFCVVPTTRGKEVSRDPQEILREVKYKASAGAKEVMLLGQTVNSYGRDLSPRYPFERLVEEIASIPQIKRVRFTSPHPQDVRKGFLDLYANVAELCPHIHLPLQSGSNRILKLMNRNYNVERYIDIVNSVRERSPDIAITSDIIVGFPTETDKDFERTMEIVEQTNYSSVFSFKYSIRPNTVAKTEFGSEDEVREDIKSTRLTTLQARQKEITHQYHSTFVGNKTEVLIEKIVLTDGNNRLLRGRNPQNILVEMGERDANTKLGDLVDVTVQSASPYSLKGEVGVM